MRQQVTWTQLARKSVELAKRTRAELTQAGLSITDFPGVVRHFGIELKYSELSNGDDGVYLKDKRQIILNFLVTSAERSNFSFCHELMHDRIEHDDEFLSLFADVFVPHKSDYNVMERVCNLGAAELLMPSAQVREFMVTQGFSTTCIPQLCTRFSASSIAAALQMVNCASHDCYLVIAELRPVPQLSANVDVPLFKVEVINNVPEKLFIQYSGASPPAQYSIKRKQFIPSAHLLYELTGKPETTHIVGQATLPFASGKGWKVNFDALYYRGKFFAFFNVSLPVSPHQLSLC